MASRSSALEDYKDDGARLRALSPLDADRYSTSLLRSYTELRSWFFKSLPYLEWCKGKEWHLICYEEPRSGKTTFAAQVAKDIKQRCTNSTDKLAVVSIFLGHGGKQSGYQEAGEVPVKAMLRAILRRLHEAQIQQQRRSGTLDALPSTASAAQAMSLHALQNLVDHEVANFEDVFLVIDGLDLISNELAQFSIQKEAIRLTKTTAKAETRRRLIFIQSQTDIHEEVWVKCNSKYPCDSQGVLYWQCDDCNDGNYHLCQHCYNAGHRCLDGSHELREPYSYVELYTHPSHDELRQYLRKRLMHEIESDSAIGNELGGARSMVQTIQDRVADSSIGSFTLAKLAMDYLTRNQSIHDIVEVLDHLPQHESEHVESLFRAVNKQLSDEDRMRALAALAIVTATYAKNRDMSFSMLAQAVDVLTKHQYTTLTPTRLFKITRNLLEVTNRAVRPINSSVQIFLSEKCAFHFDALQLDMAEMCTEQILIVLEQLPVFSDGVQATVDFSKRHPFAWYCLQNWGRFFEDGTSKRANDLAKALLEQYQKLHSLRQAIFLAVNTNKNGEMWSGSNMLHLLAYFGLDSLLLEVLKERPSLDVNVKDINTGRTPLHIACKIGHLVIAEKLMEFSADPALLDNKGHTSLSEAIKHNPPHLDLINAILEKSTSKSAGKLLNITSTLTGGQTPLMLAIKSRCHNLVDLLIQQPYININIQDEIGYTALHHAAFVDDDITLFQLIVDRAQSQSVKPIYHNLKSKFGGRTPCMILLEKNLPDDADTEQRIRIIECSLEQGMDHRTKDNYGRTLLHYASTQDFSGTIVAYLVSKGFDVNAKDKYKRTPLHVAASMRHESLTQELVRCSAELQAVDYMGLTPFDTAVLCGAPDSLTKMLSASRDGVLSQASDKRDAFLGQMIWNEPEDFLALYGPAGTSLSSDQICQTGSNGETLLHYAVFLDNAPIVRLLLKDSRLNADAVDLDGKTALHICIEQCKNNEKHMVAELLLEHKTAVNVVDKEGCTALDSALNGSHFNLAFQLLRWGAPMPLHKSILLAEAIRRGEQEAFGILIHEGADIFNYTWGGRMPSQTAADEHASDEMLRLVEREEQAILRKLEGFPLKNELQE